jgi:hypothetical protein
MCNTSKTIKIIETSAMVYLKIFELLTHRDTPCHDLVRKCHISSQLTETIKNPLKKVFMGNPLVA